MSNDGEIYTFKLYNFRKVQEEGDSSPHERWHSKIYCTDQHLFRTPHGITISPSKTVRRYNFYNHKWSTVHDPRHCRPESVSGFNTLWNDLLFFRNSAMERSGRTDESMCFTNLRKCGTNTMNFVDMISAHPIGASVENSSENVKVCPPQINGYAMAVNDVDLYVVGGTIPSSRLLTMNVYMFHMRTNLWTKLYDYALDRNPPPALARTDHEMVYYEHRLHIIGGSKKSGYAETIFSFEDLPVFNLLTNSWKICQTFGDLDEVESFPRKRTHFAIARDPHQTSVVFINGGYDLSPHVYLSQSDQVYCRDTWRLDLKTLQWKRITSLTTGPGKHLRSMNTTPDGRMYILGGAWYVGQFNGFLVAWINVPKLADMCWDAFVFYVRKGVIKLPNDLRNLGLPKKYQERLSCD